MLGAEVTGRAGPRAGGAASGAGLEHLWGPRLGVGAEVGVRLLRARLGLGLDSLQHGAAHPA